MGFLRKSGQEYAIVRPGGLTGGDGGQRPSKTPPGVEHIVAAGPEGDVSGGTSSIHRIDVAAVVYEAIKSADAKNKTIEIVSRPRADGDPSFAERAQEIFNSIPADS